MIGNDRFVQVFGSVPAGDDSKLVQIVANAVREGFHIVLCAPGTNQPVCTLPATKAKLEHDCGAAHVLSLESVLGEPEFPDDEGFETDPYTPLEKAKVRAKVQAIINRVTKAHDGVKPNIGVVPGPSGYVAVGGPAHGDGPELEEIRSMGVTVRSQTYGWRWMSVNRALPSEHPWTTVECLSLVWGESVLVPPSVYSSAYEIIGQTSPAPAWLLERIAQS